MMGDVRDARNRIDKDLDKAETTNKK